MLRRLLRLAGRRPRRPRFTAPGAGLALLFFALAALLSILGSGADGPGGIPVTPRPPAEGPPPSMAAPEPEPEPAPVEPEAEPAPPPSTAAGCPAGCLEPPPGCGIKGNTSYRTGERIYHVPGQQFYGRTLIDPSQGERWFCSEEEAVANGWRKSKR